MSTTNLTLHTTQKPVAIDPHRFRVLCCGRRWGKTTLAIDQMKARAAIPLSRIAYIAPTYQQARDIAWTELKRDCEQAAKTINESRLEIMLVNDSSIVLRGWENIETLRGQKFDLIVIDEIAMMRGFWEQWHEVIRPTLTDTKGEALFISTPKGFNHFYDLFNLEAKDSDFKSFHYSTYDNPHIDPTEVDKAKQELTEDRFAQEYLADFRKTQGLVYKEFDRKRHLVKGQMSDWYNAIGQTKVRTYGGVDFGFVHPAAVLNIEESSDGIFVVTQEWYHSGKTNEEIAEYTASQKFNSVYPDPANPGGIKDLKNHGCNVREVIKGQDSVRNGIQVVRELFKSNRLFVHESCSSLLFELETYSYGDSKDGNKINENPIKENDDACFAAGTLIDGVPIEKIGYLTGEKDVFEYEVADELLIATANHPVITNRGVVDIDSLRYDDVIWKTKKLLYMTVSGGFGIRTLFSGVIGITTSVVKRLVEARERDYTDIYGKNIMAKFLPFTMFTILMATPAIMKYLIWTVFTVLNTSRVMLQKKNEHLLGRISKKQSKKPVSGQKQKRVSEYEESLVKEMRNICLTGTVLQETVTYVSENIPHKEMGKTDSATPTVVKRRYVGLVPVYNLKTNDGMYLVNNVLVHNCDALRYVLMMVSNRKSYNIAKISKPKFVGFNKRA